MPFLTTPTTTLFYTDDIPPNPLPSPPILLLHGWCCSSHDWSLQIPFLLSSYRVLALDHRGHGRSSPSSPTNPSSYSLSTLAADVVALLAHLQIPSVVLVAHSMSTIIASMLAAERPALVKALVLVHPIYHAAPPVLKSLAADMRIDVASAPEKAAAFIGAAMYTPRAPLWLRTWHRRRVLGMAPEAVVGCMEGVAEVGGTVTGQGEVQRDYMRRRTCPRFVVTGMEGVLEWERELGVDEGRDVLRWVEEGTWLHFVEGERVNGWIGEWLGRTV
jgi:pimeloyl-ACP methyl ester carboxylesterase